MEVSAMELEANTRGQSVVVCSQSGIVDPLHPAQGIRDITAAGFEHTLLDLGVHCPAGAGELEKIEKPRLAAPLLDSCCRTKPMISIMAAPRLSRDARLFSPKEDSKDLQKDSEAILKSSFMSEGRQLILAAEDLLRELAMESIRLCRQVCCRCLIVEPLSAGIDRGEEWPKNRKFYMSLAEAARESDVTILLKNQCRAVNGHLVRGACSDAAEAVRWIDWLNQEAGEERFGFCMDVGICSLCGQDMREFILPFQKRLKVVILRDCDGHREASMLPFTCVGAGQSQTDWLGVIRGLREISYDGSLVLDFAGTASAFSPILRPQLMQLAKEVGSYFAWQIGIEGLLRKYTSIVLFGAGNMCRNYMKCYGKKYPPLFTCDNNAGLWGSVFCGLSVKPPESLKSLPEGCGIFICNIYYREIKEQLYSMGITENIEFFNDEYMPSFYFDRLEVRKHD